MSPAGFITTTPRWIRQSANALLSKCIVQIRPIFCAAIDLFINCLFRILDDPSDDSQRIGAREFDVRIRDLPTPRIRKHITVFVHGVYFWPPARLRSGFPSPVFASGLHRRWLSSPAIHPSTPRRPRSRPRLSRWHTLTCSRPRA